MCRVHQFFFFKRHLITFIYRKKKPFFSLIKECRRFSLAFFFIIHPLYICHCYFRLRANQKFSWKLKKLRVSQWYMQVHSYVSDALLLTWRTVIVQVKDHCRLSVTAAVCECMRARLPLFLFELESVPPPEPARTSLRDFYFESTPYRLLYFSFKWAAEYRSIQGDKICVLRFALKSLCYI